MDTVLGRRNHHAGHQEREDERHDRHDDPAGALLHRKAVRRASPPRRALEEAGRAPSPSCGFRLPSPEHLEPDRLLRHLAGVLGDDLTLVQDEDPVGERQDLVELE